jgi:hypothetical protein
LAKVGGCPFIDWVSWEASLVEEESEEGGLAEFSFHGRPQSCQIQVNEERVHNIHVNRSRHDVEEVMSMSDFDDDKIRSRYI